MIRIPAFKPHLRATSIPGDGVLLLAEAEGYVLHGADKARIASLIDGKRSMEEIVRGVIDSIAPAIAWSILMKMEANGWIEESRPDGDRKTAAFWFALGLDPDAAASAFAAADVRVCAASEEMAGRFGAALRRFGIAPAALGSIELSDAVRPAPPRDAAAAGFDIVLAEDYLADSLMEIDEAVRAAGRRWMLARPSGTTIWIGPLFGVEGSPCLGCLRRRLGDLRPAHRMAAHHDPERGTSEPLGGLAVTEDAACIATALEVAKVLSGAASNLAGVIRTIDLRDWASQVHRVLAHPACAVCGTAAQAEPAPVELKPRPITFDADGGTRTVPPEETLRSWEHLISPLVGITGTLLVDTQAPDVGRNYVAADIRIDRPDRLAQLAVGFRRCSAGKGIGDTQARVSALCEAVERYSGQLQGTEVKQAGTWRELEAEAIHPNAVMNYSALQYRDRDAWNRQHGSGKSFVPKPLDPDERIAWTPVWSLTEERHKLLPTELLYYYGRDWLRGREPIAAGCSNGCAAGNTLEEAFLQGFLELVERDAVAIWWYNRLRRPAIAFDIFDHHWIGAQPDRYRALGRELVMLDLTSDLGIPVVAAVSWRVGGTRGERITMGYGCHFDIRIAVQRALTEGSQMLSLDLGDKFAVMREFGEGWMEWATCADHPYLLPDAEAPARQRPGFPDFRADNLLEYIARCRETVESRGMEVLILDQTRADTRLPVVKVLVPGLRHFWPRLGPGRLYDVPVSMGWLDAPLSESELNPLGCFL